MKTTEETGSYEPRVLAFCCLYCAYAAADVAGVMRRSYPESVRLVRVPCTGRIDQIDLLKAFESGVDGVLVMGCLDGQCHYKEGNLRARQTVKLVQARLDKIGLGSGRLECHWISASMGLQFADILTEATERIRSLGPSPIGLSVRRVREAGAADGAERVAGRGSVAD